MSTFLGGTASYVGKCLGMRQFLIQGVSSNAYKWFNLSKFFLNRNRSERLSHVKKYKNRKNKNNLQEETRSTETFTVAGAARLVNTNAVTL